MRVGRKLARWIFGGLAAAAIACGALLVPGERLLMKKARHITNLDKGILSPVMWLSDQSVLLMPYHKDGDRFEFVRLDTETGVRTPLAALNTKYRSTLRSDTQFGNHFPPDATLSPDRQRLLLGPDSLSRSGRKPLAYVVVKLDGTNEVELKLQSRQFSELWLHDSHRLLECKYSNGYMGVVNGFIIHDVERPLQKVRLTVTEDPTAEFAVGVTQKEHLLLVDYYGVGHYGAIRMSDISLAAPSSDLHRFTVGLPVRARLQGLKISCRGDRITWLLAYIYTSPQSNLLHRVWPSYKLISEQRLGLWVSRLDGTEMTEIGHKTEEPQPGEVNDLQWLPGDKRLSFSYKDALYTVAVP